MLNVSSKYYTNKDVIDYSSVDVHEAINQDLNKDFNFYDITWMFANTPSKKGVHVAVKAKSVYHAAMLSPCLLTQGSIYEPSDIVILKVEPTPDQNLPKEEKL